MANFQYTWENLLNEEIAPSKFFESLYEFLKFKETEKLVKLRGEIKQLAQTNRKQALGKLDDYIEMARNLSDESESPLVRFGMLLARLSIGVFLFDYTQQDAAYYEVENVIEALVETREEYIDPEGKVNYQEWILRVADWYYGEGDIDDED